MGSDYTARCFRSADGCFIHCSERKHQELFALMQVYDQLWIRQSEALAEAVRRGLRPALAS